MENQEYWQYVPCRRNLIELMHIYCTSRMTSGHSSRKRNTVLKTSWVRIIHNKQVRSMKDFNLFAYKILIILHVLPSFTFTILWWKRFDKKWRSYQTFSYTLHSKTSYSRPTICEEVNNFNDCWLIQLLIFPMCTLILRSYRPIAEVFDFKYS